MPQPMLDPHPSNAVSAVATVMAMLAALVVSVAVVGSLRSAFAHSGLAAVEVEAPSPPEIPPRMRAAYISAAAACDGLPWEIVAGIGRVESDHGRFGGGRIDAAGKINPQIYGVLLDGTNGTVRVADTDGGALDGDSTLDRAVGPFQFIPTSWEIYGGDADGDGVADPHDIDDAIPAAVRHLCPTGTFGDTREAVLSYNRSDRYVDAVLRAADRYREG